MSQRFITVAQLMRESGLPFARAEAIVSEQTRAYRGKPWMVFAHLSAFLLGIAGVPLIVPAGDHGLGIALRLTCLLGMVGFGIVVPRVLARQAILDAARAARTAP